MPLADKVANALTAAFSKYVPSFPAATLRPAHINGFDFQCNDAMASAARAGIPARDLAAAVVADLAHDPIFETVEASGPGFVNVRLSQALLAEQAEAMASSAGLGVPNLGKGEVAVLDYGGPNIAKRLHCGHLRSFVIGESLRRILSETGSTAISDIHLGDWGLQMGMVLMEAARRWPGSGGQMPADADVEELEELYQVASKACKEDPCALEEARRTTRDLQCGEPALQAAWSFIREVSLVSVRAATEALGVHYDLFLGESDVNGEIGGMVESLLAAGLARKSDGAIVIGGNAEAGNPPLVLLKSDGAALYGSTDLATLKMRTEKLSARKIVYVVDQRQAQHLSSVFEAAALSGYAGEAELVHAGFGTVNGQDGKPYKTRDGGTPRLSDLIAAAVGKARERIVEGGIGENEADGTAMKVGMAALKFADLSSDRLTGYVFDLDRMVSFEGKTGPYLQYASVRIRSVARKATEALLYPSGMATSHPAERSLLLECLQYPDSVKAAAERLQPKEIADRAYRVAQAFSRFYAECPVIKDGSASGERLALSLLAGAVLDRCLYLLGIEVPQAM